VTAGDAGPAATPPAPSWLAARAWLLVKIGLTFNIVAVTRVFFRAPDFATAWMYLRGLAAWQQAAGPIAALNWFGLRVGVLLAVLLATELAQYRSGSQTVFLRWPWQLRGVMYAALVVTTLVLGGVDAEVPFIYFQF
jgi:hypothetical protein